MALFGKKKEESNNSSMAPPAPPVMSAPVAPPVSEESLTSVPKLTTPPMPGGSLDSIKQEVSSVSNVSTPKSVPVENPNTTNNNLEHSNDSEDLFDFSDLEIPGVDSDEGNDFVSNSSYNSNKNKHNTHYGNFEEESVDIKEEHLGDLNFISNRRSLEKPSSSETFFVTTSQFKALLEIVDSVKTKVKESSERHLRLIDIKSEEDVEYENLRKDFQFIEDKLYEVDSLIFEK